MHLASELMKEGIHELESLTEMTFEYNSYLTEENDLFLHAEYYEKQTLINLQENGHVIIFLINHCCQFIIQAKDTTRNQQGEEKHSLQKTLVI